jgi:hypothetical protein
LRLTLPNLEYTFSGGYAKSPIFELIDGLSDAVGFISADCTDLVDEFTQCHCRGYGQRSLRCPLFGGRIGNLPKCHAVAPVVSGGARAKALALAVDAMF